MNYYYYYDKILACSDNIRTLIKYDGETNHNTLLFLEVLPFSKYPENTTDKSVIVEHSNFIEISINNNLVYRIHKCESKLQVFTDDMAYIEDSIVNLPQSILAYNENNILLHCSSVLINKNIFCFVGNKGVGKTTFSLILSERFRLFSDDTLLLRSSDSNDVIGIPPNTKSKLTLHTINEFENLITEKSTFLLNSQKKMCNIVNSYFRSSPEECKVKFIFVLNRNEHRKQGLYPIQSTAAKKLFLSKNIVGNQYFPFNFCKKIQESNIFNNTITNVKMFEINLPNSIEELKQQKYKLYELLDIVGELK